MQWIRPGQAALKVLQEKAFGTVLHLHPSGIIFRKGHSRILNFFDVKQSILAPQKACCVTILIFLSHMGHVIQLYRTVPPLVWPH